MHSHRKLILVHDAMSPLTHILAKKKTVSLLERPASGWNQVLYYGINTTRFHCYQFVGFAFSDVLVTVMSQC